MVRFNPSPLSYADAGGAGAPAPFVGPTQKSVVLNDGGGTNWEVYPDGSVMAINSTTFAGVVNVLQPAGATKTKQILANLAAVSASNAQKIENIIGTSATTSLPPPKFETAPLPSTAQAAGLPAPTPTLKPPGEIGEEPTPLTEQPWFWPSVVLGGTAIVSGGLLFYFWRKKKQAT